MKNSSLTLTFDFPGATTLPVWYLSSKVIIRCWEDNTWSTDRCVKNNIPSFFPRGHEIAKIIKAFIMLSKHTSWNTYQIHAKKKIHEESMTPSLYSVRKDLLTLIWMVPAHTPCFPVSCRSCVIWLGNLFCMEHAHACLIFVYLQKTIHILSSDKFFLITLPMNRRENLWKRQYDTNNSLWSISILSTIYRAYILMAKW